jgi:hypothetical protein
MQSDRLEGFLLLSVLFLEGCSGPQRGEQSMVKAIRYEVAIADSFTDAAHGSYYLIKEIYFPDRGVVCNLTESTCRMNAFFSDIRNPSTIGVVETQEIKTPTEEILVPADLAEQIFALAELNKKAEELSLSVGKKGREAGILDGKTRPLAVRE